MRKVKQDGGICYHVNILHALVSVYIEIEKEIYQVTVKFQKPPPPPPQTGNAKNPPLNRPSNCRLKHSIYSNGSPWLDEVLLTYSQRYKIKRCIICFIVALT